MPLFASPSSCDSGTDSLLKEAERLYLEGIRLAKQKQYPEALSKFRASYRIVPSTPLPKHEYIRGSLHFLIGRTYHLTENWIEARNHYRMFLKKLPTDARRSRAENWLKEIRPKLLAKVHLEVSPQATCTVQSPGNQWEGSSPATLVLEAGKIKIQCQAPEHRPATFLFSIAPRSTTTKQFQLQPLPKAPKPRDLRWVGLVIGGVGLAAVAVGGVMGGVALSQHKQATDARDSAKTPTDTSFALNLANTAQSSAMAANVLYIAGGGVALTGLIVYFVLWPRQASPARAFLAPQHRSQRQVVLLPFSDSP